MMIKSKPTIMLWRFVDYLFGFGCLFCHQNIDHHRNKVEKKTGRRRHQNTHKQAIKFIILILMVVVAMRVIMHDDDGN